MDQKYIAFSPSEDLFIYYWGLIKTYKLNITHRQSKNVYVYILYEYSASLDITNIKNSNMIMHNNSFDTN